MPALEQGNPVITYELLRMPCAGPGEAKDPAARRVVLMLLYGGYDMRAYDLSPLLRSSIGFDRFNRLFDAASRMEEAANGYPPYNIEKQGEDKYRVTLAVAGFTQDELAIVAQENSLLISGKANAEEKPESTETKVLHRGIARRPFERRFELAETIKVTGATLENGLLHVDLVRVVPESMKPRQIKITTGAPAEPQAVESKAA